ncbi:hypothetical protein BaRGS_00037805, partial [Batillaria attramentaria]
LKTQGEVLRTLACAVEDGHLRDQINHKLALRENYDVNKCTCRTAEVERSRDGSCLPIGWFDLDVCLSCCTRTCRVG